jgi:hypothetical protein
MKSIHSIVFVAVLGIILSCNTSHGPAEDKDPLTVTEVNKVVSLNPQPADNNEQELYADSTGQRINNDKKGQPQPAQQPVIQPDWDKKIIKTAMLNAEVKDYNSFYSSLRGKVKALGGYIAQEEQSQSDYKIENSLIIKVPVDQFDNAVVQLAANTEKINEKKITSQDVTAEVIDTKSRMEAKRQVRLRYMDLLKQAKNMEEILNVQAEINAVQEQIESAAGRIGYLDHASVFSTIHLTYYQVLNPTAKDKGDHSFGTRLSSAFRTGWSWIGEVLVGLVAVWPLFLLAFIALVIYRKMKVQKPK